MKELVIPPCLNESASAAPSLFQLALLIRRSISVTLLCGVTSACCWLVSAFVVYGRTTYTSFLDAIKPVIQHSKNSQKSTCNIVSCPASF